ncbi:molybdopterin-dependent oxidoreductase [Streptomyces sp. NPDC092296]|uniref:molybdopterin-dependent oxidoreductase n=1 Tax=Streptomyces sp. NPDC092296 TaxID=3366012 RepID=UPI0037FFFD41
MTAIREHQAPPSSRPAIRRRAARAGSGALVGLLSAAAALGAGEAVAAFTGPRSSPVIAVGSQAIDLTPTPLKEYAVRTFGTHDKLVLLGGIYSVLTLIALAAGFAALRHPRTGPLLFAGFGAVGAWAAAARPTAVAADTVPSLAAALVGAAALLLLVRTLRVPHPTAADPHIPDPHTPHPHTPHQHTPGRRSFVRTAGGTALLAAGTGLGGRALSARRYDTGAARAAVRIPAPARRAPAVPLAARPRVPGLSPFLTPAADFYRVDTALVLPQVDPRDWTLRIHGMVDHPVELTFDDLLGRTLEEHDQTLSCVSNEVGGPYAGTARWIGAPLAGLLREAGVRRGADQLVSRSVDGMSIGTPVDAVLDGRAALLAVAMGGEALPVAHGFPCRMLVPGLFGYVSATKWLVDLELTTFDAYDPYWVRRRWAARAPVKTASRIEVPKPFARIAAGPVTVAGTAWATHRGIDAVEVRVDGGAWAEARLAARVSEDVWRQWTYDWQAPPGTHRIEVRATDGTGALQPAARAAPFPDGATGWHSTVVTVS